MFTHSPSFSQLSNPNTLGDGWTNERRSCASSIQEIESESWKGKYFYGCMPLAFTCIHNKQSFRQLFGVLTILWRLLLFQRRVFELRTTESLQLVEKTRTESSDRNLLSLYFADLQETCDFFKLAHNVIALIETEDFDQQYFSFLKIYANSHSFSPREPSTNKMVFG